VRVWRSRVLELGVGHSSHLCTLTGRPGAWEACSVRVCPTGPRSEQPATHGSNSLHSSEECRVYPCLHGQGEALTDVLIVAGGLRTPDKDRTRTAPLHQKALGPLLRDPCDLLSPPAEPLAGIRAKSAPGKS